MEDIQLNNGIKMPVAGFGVFWHCRLLQQNLC